MELYLTPIFVTENQQTEQNRNEKGQFVKGSTPWNKGKKWGVHPNFVKHQYKSGNEPVGTLHDGAISIRFHKRDGRSYKYIRVAKGKWILLQHFVWMKHNGPIPKNHVIVLKDGDTMNCSIKNLECISRAENMKRNTNRKKQAETIRELWKREKLRKEYGLKPRTKLNV